MLRECLSLTSATGQSANEAPNFELYGRNADFMPQYNEDLRIRQITVCYGNGKGNLKGFQFRIGGSSFVNLPLVGKRGIP